MGSMLLHLHLKLVLNYFYTLMMKQQKEIKKTIQFIIALRNNKIPRNKLNQGGRRPAL